MLLFLRFSILNVLMFLSVFVLQLLPYGNTFILPVQYMIPKAIPKVFICLLWYMSYCDAKFVRGNKTHMIRKLGSTSDINRNAICKF